MSAPSDGARADARKARAEAMGIGRIEDMICPCSFPGYTHVTAVHGQPEPPSDWLAGVIADAKAEGAREERLRLHHVPTENSGECSLCWEPWPCADAWTEHEVTA